jgi:hypothetical protein
MMLREEREGSEGRMKLFDVQPSRGGDANNPPAETFFHFASFAFFARIPLWQWIVTVSTGRLRRWTRRYSSQRDEFHHAKHPCQEAADETFDWFVGWQ